VAAPARVVAAAGLTAAAAAGSAAITAAAQQVSFIQLHRLLGGSTCSSSTRNGLNVLWKLAQV
jgi:hypothetical protein